MRQEFQAPIESSRYYGYRYSRPWSLLEGMDDEPLGTLNELVALVRGLAENREESLAGLGEALLALEQQVSLINAEPYRQIEFENPVLKGRNYLIPLHRFIRHKAFVRFLYNPFNALSALWITVFPSQLKEFNNRWYLVGWALEGGQADPVIRSFALDRIEQPPSETATLGTFDCPQQPNLSSHYEHLIGVTKVGVPEWVELQFTPVRANYVLTKKLHPSQTVEQQADGTWLIRIFVELNKELTARILEFGKDVLVISPSTLRGQIIATLQESLASYH